MPAITQSSSGVTCPGFPSQRFQKPKSAQVIACVTYWLCEFGQPAEFLYLMNYTFYLVKINELVCIMVHKNSKKIFFDFGYLTFKRSIYSDLGKGLDFSSPYSYSVGKEPKTEKKKIASCPNL